MYPGIRFKVFGCFFSLSKQYLIWNYLFFIIFFHKNYNNTNYTFILTRTQWQYWFFSLSCSDKLQSLPHYLSSHLFWWYNGVVLPFNFNSINVTDIVFNSSAHVKTQTRGEVKNSKTTVKDKYLPINSVNKNLLKLLYFNKILNTKMKFYRIIYTNIWIFQYTIEVA